MANSEHTTGPRIAFEFDPPIALAARMPRARHAVPIDHAPAPAEPGLAKFAPSFRPTAAPNLSFPALAHSWAERSPRALASHSMLQGKRIITRWVRDPLTMLQAIIYPAFTLLMFRIVLGDSITAYSGVKSVYGTVPMIALVGAIFGSIASGVELRNERLLGLISRFWVLPVHRASSLIGRLIAESARILLTTVFIILVGIVLGFRFNQGALPSIGLIFVPLLFGVAFATMVTALATSAREAPLVEYLSMICSLLMFFNSGFVPVAAYPVWLQAVVENQPMSTAIDTMRALALGGPIAIPLIKSIVWSIVIFGVFVIPAIRGYRRAAEQGR